MIKKSLAPFFVLAIFLFACNNATDDGKKTTLTKADTLYEEVMDGHDVGMGKMAKLTRAEQEVNRLLDSIGKLPAKAQQLSAPYKSKLDDLLADLKSADSSMDNWMENFQFDTLKSDIEKRIKYLEIERVKVGAVKQSILNSLQKADSVLKKDL